MEAANEPYRTNNRTNLSALTSVAVENIIDHDEIDSKLHPIIHHYSKQNWIRCEDHKALVDKFLCGGCSGRRGIEEVRTLIKELVAMKLAAKKLCQLKKLKW